MKDFFNRFDYKPQFFACVIYGLGFVCTIFSTIITHDFKDRLLCAFCLFNFLFYLPEKKTDNN